MRHPIPYLLCALGLLCGAAAPRTVTIHNLTPNVLRGVYLSPADADSWGPDRATENVRIKAKLALALPGPGCRWVSACCWEIGRRSRSFAIAISVAIR